MKELEVVGKFTLQSTTEFTEHYECAAWHRTGSFEPQTVKLLLERAQFNRPYRLYARLKGVITSACLVSRLGASYGSDSGPDEVGKFTEYTHVIDPAYGLDDRVELQPEYQWLRDVDSWDTVCLTEMYTRWQSKGWRLRAYDARHINLEWVKSKIPAELWQDVCPYEQSVRS